ncbi:hypothetical protein A1O1_01326 [Capronia coronata CBS 617.96]|uniref:Uncharacterized protein n=1 Tax=Capronia coronata CBS 617.96 TaxID=1182541 RepID=W9Z2K7_9EURO|nr:uncharacterized protein A1O1_01326 [Capronia coronata CBS 617.96]EXJ96200.1 hypothetical protein A1O1_01326 [Capronia coronata CBS 617.96]
MSGTTVKNGNLAPTSTKYTAGKRSPSAGRSSKQPEPKKSKQTATNDSKHTLRAPVHATTFGIEFEFTVAFKQDLLESTLARHNLNADIIKHFTDNEHRNLLGEFAQHYEGNPSHNCRFRYPSWALHVPQEDIVSMNGLHHGNFITKMTQEKQWMRRYVMEPLLMVKENLQQKKLPCNVVGWVEPDPANPSDPKLAEIPFPGEDEAIMIRKSIVDYTDWTLTNDHTLVGPLRSQLREHLEKEGVSKKEVDSWDSSGVELVSPVFELEKKTEAFESVGKYLDSLSGKDTSIMESVWASTHVHIGLVFENPEDMPMLLLQHLAYILVLHEDLLTKCHPRSRSGVELQTSSPSEAPLKDYDDAEDEDEDEEFDPDAPVEPPPSPSEQEKEQENEAKVLAFEAEYTGVGNVDSNARYLRQHLTRQNPRHQLREIRDQIFQEQGTIFDLVELLQRPTDASDRHGNRHRGYMYNFANLWALAKGETPWKPIKPTIEFRQHACTLDSEVVRHWVPLLEAIVNTAERKAAQTTQFNNSTPLDATRTFAEREASKYPTASGTWPYETMQSFCVRFLGLDDEEGDYWQGRFETYKDDRPVKA